MQIEVSPPNGVCRSKVKKSTCLRLLFARRRLYVVLSVERTKKGKFATITPLRYTTMDALPELVTERVEITGIQLLEQNRGKAGVLNVTREFLLHYTYYFNRLKCGRFVYIVCNVYQVSSEETSVFDGNY